MQPRVDHRPTHEALALGYLTFVVRKDVVDAARVYVEPLSKVLDRHGGAFDMPPGKPLAPGAVPLQLSSRLSRFPERKVPLAALQPVDLDPDAFQKAPLIDVSREHAVWWEGLHVEVDVPFRLVCGALLYQTLDDSNHVRHVGRRSGIDVGWLDIQFPLVAEELLRVVLRNLPEGVLPSARAAAMTLSSPRSSISWRMWPTSVMFLTWWTAISWNSRARRTQSVIR